MILWAAWYVLSFSLWSDLTAILSGDWRTKTHADRNMSNQNGVLQYGVITELVTDSDQILRLLRTHICLHILQSQRNVRHWFWFSFKRKPLFIVTVQFHVMSLLEKFIYLNSFSHINSYIWNASLDNSGPCIAFNCGKCLCIK